MARFDNKWGKPAIVYTDDSTQPRVFLLDAPLRSVRPGHSLAVYTRESLDRSKVEYVTVSGGAYEVIGSARYSDDGVGLVDLLKAGSQGKTLTYYPNVADGGVSAAVQLLSPVGDAGLELDADRGSRGEYSLELRFRTTDGALWEQPFQRDSGLLFSYRAGGNLSRATFTRVTSTSAPATYVASPGYGTLSTAKTGQARTNWISTNSSVGPRDTAGLLLEGARTNYVAYSEAFNQWTTSGTGTLTSGQTDPMGNTDAWLLRDTSTSSNNNISHAVTSGLPNPSVMSIFVKDDDSTAGMKVALYDSTAGAYRANMHVLFSSGVPAVSYITGSSVAPPERYSGGWYRVQVRTSTSVVTAATGHRIYIFPAATTAAGAGNVGSTGGVYAFGAQVE